MYSRLGRRRERGRKVHKLCTWKSPSTDYAMSNLHSRLPNRSLYLNARQQTTLTRTAVAPAASSDADRPAQRRRRPSAMATIGTRLEYMDVRALPICAHAGVPDRVRDAEREERRVEQRQPRPRAHARPSHSRHAAGKRAGTNISRPEGSSRMPVTARGECRRISGPADGVDGPAADRGEHQRVAALRPATPARSPGRPRSRCPRARGRADPVQRPDALEAEAAADDERDEHRRRAEHQRAVGDAGGAPARP